LFHQWKMGASHQSPLDTSGKDWQLNVPIAMSSQNEAKYYSVGASGGAKAAVYAAPRLVHHLPSGEA